MSQVQNIESTPPYIGEFLKQNMDQLISIYDEGKKELGIGCLVLKCSQTENKMDVFYMTDEMMLETLQKESWEQLKTTIAEKKLFVVNDLDLKSIFLIYI